MVNMKESNWLLEHVEAFNGDFVILRDGTEVGPVEVSDFCGSKIISYYGKKSYCWNKHGQPWGHNDSRSRHENDIVKVLEYKNNFEGIWMSETGEITPYLKRGKSSIDRIFYICDGNEDLYFDMYGKEHSNSFSKNPKKYIKLIRKYGEL